MEPKRLIELTVGIVVGLVVFSAILMPVISNAQTNNGTEVTLTQEYDASFAPNYNLWDGEDVTISFSADGFMVNDELVTIAVTQRILVASNDFACRSGGSGTTSAVNIQYLGHDGQYATSFTFTVVDGVYTLSAANGAISLTGNLDWMVYAVPGEGNIDLVQPSLTTSFITGNTDNIIVLGNVYTTGENDTFYSYYNGDLTVNPAFEGDASVTIDKTVKEGYTDIYDTSITVNIGDESFTPWFILTPKTIAGHEASGPIYDMLGVIPILIIAGLIIGIVGVALSRRE